MVKLLKDSIPTQELKKQNFKKRVGLGGCKEKKE